MHVSGPVTSELEATWAEIEVEREDQARTLDTAASASDDTRSFVYDARAEAAESEEPLRERLLGGVTYNAAGRWVITDVDESLLEPRESSDVEMADVESGPLSSPDGETWPADGEVVTWEPMSWTHLDCVPGGGDEVHLWNSESRSAANMAWDRPQTAVRVVFTCPTCFPSGDYQCSGTILRDDWVLTAAHCLVEDGFTPMLFNNQLKVYRDWISSTPNYATSYYINPDWAAVGTDFDDDWALIKLGSSFTGPNMNLSNAGDTVLQGVDDKFHNLGYPPWAPTCTATNDQTVFHSADNDVTAYQNVRLRWRGDGTPGQSGGAIYYCPEGDDAICGAGEKGWVVSVFAGWNPVLNRFVGPRVSEWDDEAITYMNTH